MRNVYSLSHYHVNALCFLSTCLCQTKGGPVLGCQGRRGASHVSQAPTRCSSLLAQFTRSLAPQTLLLASSLFSPSVLASLQAREDQSVGMRWEDSIQKHLTTNRAFLMTWIQIDII